MPILNFKPHKLYYQSATTGGYDDNGDWVEGTAEWVECCACDTVPNGKEESIVYDDGEVGKYTYTVYLPTSCREFKKGERVRIDFFKSTKSLEFEVLGFHRYQHQCKLWV